MPQLPMEKKNVKCIYYISISLHGVAGHRMVGDDGIVYEVVVDEKTGKKFKKYVFSSFV